jgi:hypothetical protein
MGGTRRPDTREAEGGLKHAPNTEADFEEHRPLARSTSPNLTLEEAGAVATCLDAEIGKSALTVELGASAVDHEGNL